MQCVGIAYMICVSGNGVYAEISKRSLRPALTCHHKSQNFYRVNLGRLCIALQEGPNIRLRFPGILQKESLCRRSCLRRKHSNVYLQTRRCSWRMMPGHISMRRNRCILGQCCPWTRPADAYSRYPCIYHDQFRRCTCNHGSHTLGRARAPRRCNRQILVGRRFLTYKYSGKHTARSGNSRTPNSAKCKCGAISGMLHTKLLRGINSRCIPFCKQLNPRTEKDIWNMNVHVVAAVILTFSRWVQV